MHDAGRTPEEESNSWADMFRGIRGVYTILLNVGIGVHAIDDVAVDDVHLKRVSPLGQ